MSGLHVRGCTHASVMQRKGPLDVSAPEVNTMDLDVSALDYGMSGSRGSVCVHTDVHVLVGMPSVRNGTGICNGTRVRTSQQHGCLALGGSRCGRGAPTYRCYWLF